MLFRSQVDSIMETIDFVNKLYQAKVLNESEERFNNIIFNLQRAAAITVVQLLLKMQIKNYFIEKTKTNLCWIKVFSLANKNRIYDDMLDNHKPINPIIRNFFESPYSNKN